MSQIAGKQLKDGSVEGAKLADAPNGVSTGKINNDAVDETKLDLSHTYDFAGGGGDVQVADVPAGDSSSVNKKYVRESLDGLHPKQSVRLATGAVLPAYTTAGSGVGKTITINAVGILQVDGVNTVLDDRILVKDEGVSHVDHGIYEVTTEGTVSVAAVLTRVTDFDGSPTGEVENGDYTWTGPEGTVNSDSQWTLITNNPITVDTTALQFTQTSGAGQITAGDGLDKTGNTIFVGENVTGCVQANADDVEVLTDDVTIEDDGGAAPAKLRVKDVGITEAKLNASVAGNGITGGGGSKLAVVSDVSGGANLAKVINVSVNGVAVKIDDDTVKENGSAQLKAATKTKVDKNLAVSTTTADGQSSGVAISKTPAGDRMVRVEINSISQVLGDGVKTTDCYFSGDGGTTARAIGAIVATDIMYWNGSIAGFELAAATDKCNLDYDTAA